MHNSTLKRNNSSKNDWSFLRGYNYLNYSALKVVGVADKAEFWSFSTWFLGKLAKMVFKKLAQLDEQVFKTISALIVIWYNPTHAQTWTLNKPPKITLKRYLLLRCSSFFSFLNARVRTPDQQYKRAIRARFLKFCFWRTFFCSVFLSLFPLQAKFYKRALMDCLYCCSGACHKKN